MRSIDDRTHVQRSGVVNQWHCGICGGRVSGFYQFSRYRSIAAVPIRQRTALNLHSSFSLRGLPAGQFPAALLSDKYISTHFRQGCSNNTSIMFARTVSDCFVLSVCVDRCRACRSTALRPPGTLARVGQVGRPPHLPRRWWGEKVPFCWRRDPMEVPFSIASFLELGIHVLLFAFK
jgi:hypothetical protein